ncbi:MAG TPA: hypothetical protein VJ255_11630, partial [Candidatus Acidoferrum sp.]|nr:hypothetical protein [Candidatus Acidoferrum sp.]
MRILAEDTFLADDLLRQLMSVGEVDLLVGVSSHNAADKLGEAVQAIERCFQQFFVRQRVVIVNIDGGDKEPPQDDPAASPVANPAQTAETIVPRQGITSLRTINRVTANYSAPPSPGTALRTLLAAADLLRARACAVVAPAT